MQQLFQLRKGISRSVTMIEIAVLLIVIIGIAFILFTRQKSTSTSQNQANKNATTNGTVLSNTNAPAFPADDDGDGLSNAEEAKLGTNPKKADTDGDGLIDSDEVRIYKSNPLKADTDGDGISDGEAVKRGMDPTDHTKSLLPNINQAKSQFTNQ